MSTILLKQKDYEELSQCIIDLNLKIVEQGKELERLNNIINKTIKYCEESSMTLKSHYFEDVIKLLKGEK